MKRLYSAMNEEYNNNTTNEEKNDECNVDYTASKRMLQRNKDTIKTYCRIKAIENDTGIFKISESDNKNLLVNPPEEEVNLYAKYLDKYQFTQIFDAFDTQAEIFESTCLPLIEDLLNKKKSGLVFAFGLTNSGKTYTITGKPENPGILPLTLRNIIDKIEKLEEKPELYCNTIEIYNEEVFDLLTTDGKDKPKKKVHIKEKDKTFYIKGITDRRIFSIEELNDCLNTLIYKKTMACTNLNSESSRSHTIFKIILRWHSNDEEDFEEASLSIVDLAGSERSSRAETSGKELQQACKINQSLLTLGKCLKIMKDNSTINCHNRMIVPFRDSKLTKLFQQYLTSEESNIIMITNINPSKEDFRETCITLAYACTAREIKPTRSKVDHTNSLFTNNLKNREKNKKKKEVDINNNINYNSSDNSYSDDDSNFNFKPVATFQEENLYPFGVAKMNQTTKMSAMNYNRHSFAPEGNMFYQSQPNNFYPTSNILFEEMNELKYKLENISKKYAETQERCENLEKKNERLNIEIIQLKYQFDLNQVNCRYELLKMLSNQTYKESRYEDFRSALECNRNMDSNPNPKVLINPYYVSASKKDTQQNQNVSQVEENVNTNSNEVKKNAEINTKVKIFKISKSEENNTKSEVIKPVGNESNSKTIPITTTTTTTIIIPKKELISPKKKIIKEVPKQEDHTDLSITNDESESDVEQVDNKNKKKKNPKKNKKAKKNAIIEEPEKENQNENVNEEPEEELKKEEEHEKANEEVEEEEEVPRHVEKKKEKAKKINNKNKGKKTKKSKKK